MHEQVSWRTVWGLRTKAGKASDYIAHFEMVAYPGLNVVLWCRVSHHLQDHAGNLADQRANLERVSANRGCVIVDAICEAESGKEPFRLIRAVELARKNGACVLAESTDRFIRNKHYHSSRFPDAQATKDELESLRLYVDGVTLMTVVPPDASPSEVRSYQRKRGQEQKGNRGGRLVKCRYERHSHETTAKAVAMYPAFSYREIADFLTTQTKTRITRATVQSWIKTHRRKVYDLSAESTR